jgi:hypothetical protein
MEDTFQEHLKNLNDSFINERDQLNQKHNEQKTVTCTKTQSILLLLKFSCVLLTCGRLIECLHVIINIIYPPCSSFIMLSTEGTCVTRLKWLFYWFSLLAHFFKDIEHAIARRWIPFLFKTVAFLIILKALMNTLFIIKVKICFLGKLSYRSLQLCWVFFQNS